MLEKAAAALMLITISALSCPVMAQEALEQLPGSEGAAARFDRWNRKDRSAGRLAVPMRRSADPPEEEDPPFDSSYMGQMAMHFAPYFFAGPAPAESYGEGPGFRYCTYEPPAGVEEDPGAVTYFLHYAGGDEKTWSQVPISRVYYAEFRKRNKRAPRVISVSYGKNWMLFDKPGPRQPLAMYEHFTGTAMPWLEARLSKVPERRYLWGMSQGGLNGALLLFKNPKPWSGAVIACPAFFSVSVFAEDAAANEYAQRTHASIKVVDWGIHMIRSHVANEAEWKREDPLARAAAADLPALPPIYVDSNTEDQFGFVDAIRKFVEDLKSKGNRVELLEHSGPHCAVDAPADAGFLADIAPEPARR